MVNRLAEIVKEVYPDNPDLFKDAQNYFGNFWMFARSIRETPRLDQARFFTGLLNHALEFTAKEEEAPRQGGLNIEGAAQLMVDINTSPLRTELLSKEQITTLAAKSLKAIDIDHNPNIRLVEDLNEVGMLFSKLCWQIFSDRKHPISATLEFVRAKGYYHFASTVFAPDWGFLAAGVATDIIAAAGFASNTNRRGRSLGDAFRPTFFTPSPYAEQMGQYGLGRVAEESLSHPGLSQAMAWEVMLPRIMEEHPEIKGNPWRVFVDVIRPSQWPIGWDHEAREFLVATP